MKHFITSISLLFITLSVQSQKIKLKKEIIYADKNKIGKLIKVKEQNDLLGRKVKHFDLYDVNDKLIYQFTTEYVVSPLFHFDSPFRYYGIRDMATNHLGYIENNKYYFTKKNLVKYLINNNYISKEGVKNDAVCKELVLSKDSIPKSVIDGINIEKKLAKNASYIVERPESEYLYFKPLKPTTEDSMFNRYSSKPLMVKNFLILSGKLIPGPVDNRIPIGKVRVEYKQDGKTYKNIIILNKKNIPLVKVSTFHYHYYHPYKEISFKERSIDNNSDIYRYFQKFKKQNLFGQLDMIVRDLISKNKI